ncbi:hypothetical protein PCL1606_33310 [Pseudomonas chlororaphis]|uniref:Uncharacterized protein n=1 Tax=Pseudomonas chlororaphis TaxID=587753 RepID=A0A0D5Y1A9_9PSED|nr:hypothetical protein PCL1606_33310 [Pseudomonas chlororaphis]
MPISQAKAIACRSEACSRWSLTVARIDWVNASTLGTMSGFFATGSSPCNGL